MGAGARTLGGRHDVGDLAGVQLGGGQRHAPRAVHHHRLEIVRLVKRPVAVRVRSDDHLSLTITCQLLSSSAFHALSMHALVRPVDHVLLPFHT